MRIRVVFILVVLSSIGYLSVGCAGLSAIFGGAAVKDGGSTAPSESVAQVGAEPESATSMTSAMAGYNSRFNPAHISSGEAMELFAANSGAVILDVRSAESYAERHVSIAINVPFERVADYAETNIPDKDTVIICYCFCDDKGGAALSACVLLADIGYTNAWYMEPDSEWTYEGTLVEENQGGGSVHVFITGNEARELFESDPAVILLDVRNRSEYDAGHIDGSTLIPVAELEGRLPELPDRGATIIVYCRSGVRSASAYEILTSNGYVNVLDMQSVNNWPGAGDQ